MQSIFEVFATQPEQKMTSLSPKGGFERGLLAIWLVLSLMTQTALADDARFREAKLLFEEGLAHMQAHRYPEAIDAFEHSASIRDSASVRYNLGLAYQEVGKFKEALAAFDAFRALTDERDAALVKRVDALALNLRQSMATLHLTLRGGTEEATLNAEVIATHDGNFKTTINPGTYRLMIRKSQFEPIVREFVAQKQSVITFELDASASRSTSSPTGIVSRQEPVSMAKAPDQDTSSSIFSKWWFWAGTAGLVTLGVVSAIVLASDSGADTGATPGTLGTVTTAHAQWSDL